MLSRIDCGITFVVHLFICFLSSKNALEIIDFGSLLFYEESNTFREQS